MILLMAKWPFGGNKFEWLLQWAGISLDYLIAGAMVLGGAYLVFQFTTASAWGPWFKPLRGIGFVLIGAGLIFGALTYGKTIGASDCEARWKRANLQAQIERARQETEAQKQAAAIAQEQAATLEQEKQTLEQQVQEYDKYLQGVVAEQAKNAVTGCELTADDVRQLRSIAGTGTARRKNPR